MSNLDNNTNKALDISSAAEKHNMEKQTVVYGDPILNTSEELRERQTADDLLNERYTEDNSYLQDLNPNQPQTGVDGKQTVGRLELLEERAVVDKERLDVGKIIARKKIRSKTIQVPIELIEEVLVIETIYHDAQSKDVLMGDYKDEDIIRHIEPTLDHKASITVNGKKIELGDAPVEIVLSRQVAQIAKQTYVVQEVEIEKSFHTHQDTINVELRREELDVVEEGLLDHTNVKR